MIKQHNVLEQLDGNVALNSSVVAEQEESDIKPDPSETKAEFKFTVDDSKTVKELDEELLKHWESGTQ